VLTYVHTGAELLSQLLSVTPGLACTSATGLLPVCHEAISAWQQAEGRTGRPSALAIKSVRALATAMITYIQAGHGARRWCEIAYSGPEVAETFLQVFPGARFLCLYRSMPGVLGEAVAACPWGLGDSPFWAYSSGHPGNNIATIATYWTVRTEALLDFEGNHPGPCLRVRYEDIADDPGQRFADIADALGLSDGKLSRPRVPAWNGQSGSHQAALEAGKPRFPIDRIPVALGSRASEVSARLGYEF
jgi:Sulfotransferase family